ncbi:MLP-like protein [Arachis hypogaea]|nr:MLP-like protein [Arachis hypogaea]
MALTGKLSSEIGIHAPAAKFFHLMTKQLDHVQNVCERVHETKLHEGDDWHCVGGSVKHWTYVIDGKVTTCKETVESIDEQNLSASYKLFDGDVSQHYKVFYVAIWSFNIIIDLLIFSSPFNSGTSILFITHLKAQLQHLIMLTDISVKQFVCC